MTDSKTKLCDFFQEKIFLSAIFDETKCLGKLFDLGTDLCARQ